jgi:hypothetical protein
MIALILAGNPDDVTSSPFYDYAGSDTMFVGDSVGRLHKFSPAFGGGTPAEVMTNGFPVQVSQGAQPLADPVYDSGLALVFVGDRHAARATDDGEVHSVDVSAATVLNSSSVCYGNGYLDGPLLDPTARKIYFTCGDDVGGGNCTRNGATCIRQFDETSVEGSSGVGQALGPISHGAIMPGAFDDLYLSSPDGSNPSGNIYVCGNAGGVPTLYRVPISAGVMEAPMLVTALSTSSPTTGSPVTEFFNSATDTDWLFLSVSWGGNQTAAGCSGCGCTYSFNVTEALNAGAGASSGIAVSGGSSGIIVDGVGSSPVANVYYSTLANQPCTGGTGGCAVQATQNGLR